MKAEGIFRINPENSQEELVRDQLNRGIVPRGIDVHCLSGLIKVSFEILNLIALFLLGFIRIYPLEFLLKTSFGDALC